VEGVPAQGTPAVGEALEEKNPPHLGQPAVQVAGTGALLGQYLAPISLTAYKKRGGVLVRGEE